MTLSVIWTRLFYMHNILMVLLLSLSSMCISVFCVCSVFRCVCVCVCVRACVCACVMGQVAWIKYDLIWYDYQTWNFETFIEQIPSSTQRKYYVFHIKLWITCSLNPCLPCSFCDTKWILCWIKRNISVTSHAFTPPPSEFGRDVVIISYHGRSFGFIVISGVRLGVASERTSHGWVNGSSNERVGMIHEFGFQFEFHWLLEFSQ